MFFYNDPTFFLLIPALLLAVYAQFKVSSTFDKYSKISSKRGLKSFEVSRSLLDDAGLSNIPVKRTEGNLTDNYNPSEKVLNLSSSVFDSSSVAAIGVAAHEVGHAIQDSKKYIPLSLRSNLVPAANIGSQFAFPLFFFGIILSIPILMDIGIVAFALAVTFQIITLPVELNASKRALGLLSSGGYLSKEELPMAKEVLNAAALTYIAATAMAVLNLIRLLILKSERD